MKQTSETLFQPDWLSLREPVDHAARAPGLLAQAAACVDGGMTILDLGSGTGSTARAFAAAGFPDLHWRFFDNDPALLSIANARHPKAECVLGDLRHAGDLPLDGVGLITASALFDLMPEDWVGALMTQAFSAGIPIYTALNYNGIMRWSPSDLRDDAITQAFNRHQKKDKGMGPALGPDSGSRFAQLCQVRGCDVISADSPWRLGVEETALHHMLLTGIGRAAHEAGAMQAPGWCRDRQNAVSDTEGIIGHTDHLAIPKRKTRQSAAEPGGPDARR